MVADPEDAPFVRTTVTLREDLYQKLKRQNRGLSRAINEILDREFQPDHELFDTASLETTEDVRDHEDRV